MQKNFTLKHFFILLMMFPCHFCFSQIISGKVQDTRGKSAVPWVKVLTSPSQKYTYTDHEGKFNAFAEAGDTLIFSLTNFHTQTHVLSSSPEDPLVIYLDFDAIELPEVFVMERNGNTSIQLHGIKKVDPDYVPMRPGHVAVGSTEDYRPGVFMAGPISFFSKAEKHKRKYRAAEEVRSSQKNYLEVIHSDSMRSEIKTHFSLTRQTYDSLLILFNVANRQHQFRGMEKQRVEKMLFYFINNAVRKDN